MIICYLRSSSANTYETCPRQYYLTYGLGWQTTPPVKSRIKAEKGTIAHAVFEILATRQLAKQRGEKTYAHETIGEQKTSFIDTSWLIETVYEYYTKRVFNDHEWTSQDFKDVKEWVWSLVKFNDGQFSPLRRKIVQPEQAFNIELPYDWAEYSFKTFDGKEIKGRWCLKGTIDLLTELSPTEAEIIDFKTGERKKFPESRKKELADFQKDTQLRLYHYVASKLFPQYKQIYVTIFYVRDGGPFTVCFDENDMEETERMLKNKFLTIAGDQLANTISHKHNWVCKYLCSYSKKRFPEKDILPIIQDKDGPFTKAGEPLTMCEHAGVMLEEHGMDFTSYYLKSPTFDPLYYQAPGGGV